MTDHYPKFRAAVEADVLLAVCVAAGLTIVHVDTTAPYPACVADLITPPKCEPQPWTPPQRQDRDKPWRRWPVRR